MTGEAQKFGPYELVRRLGVGGMAETFVAKRRGPGQFEQTVCLKRILPTYEEDAQFVALFMEEARLAARLRHANVVQVIDFGVEAGRHYLALELIDGCDLRTLLKALEARGEALPAGLLVYVAGELGAALDFAHSGDEPIVHRDISPSNVLLGFAGDVKLSDFGIARAMKSAHATSTAQVKGKIPYMAPEYALTGRVEPRVDLFALGVLLYESLAGRRPFDGATDLDTLRRLEKGEHVPLAEACPDAPRVLVDAIETLIRPRPEDRFRSATELLDALVAVAPPPTARRSLGELVKGVVKTAPASTRPPAGSGVDPTGATPQAPAATAIPRPRGTQLAPGVSPVHVAEPAAAVAGPDERTRTRAPQPGEVGRADTAGLGAAPPPAEATHTVPNADVVAQRAAAEAKTAVLREPGTLDPRARPAVAPSRRPVVLGVAALLAVAAVAAVAWTVGGSGDAASGATRAADAGTSIDADPDASAASDAGAEADAEVDAELDPDARTDAALAPSAAAPAATGHIRVVAVPWGTVTIDDTPRGRAPVSVELPAGHHVVAVTSAGRTQRRAVELAPGDTRQVTLEFR